MRRFLYVLMRFPGGLFALMGMIGSLSGFAAVFIGVRIGMPQIVIICFTGIFGLALIGFAWDAIAYRKPARMKLSHIRANPERYFTLLGQLDERVVSHPAKEYMRKMAVEDHPTYEHLVLVHDAPFGVGRRAVLMERDYERVYDQVSLRDIDHLPVKFYEWMAWSSLVKVRQQLVPIKTNEDDDSYGSVDVSFMDTDPARVSKVWRTRFFTIVCMKPRENREDDATKDAVDFAQIGRFDYATCEELEELLQVIDSADNGTR